MWVFVMFAVGLVDLLDVAVWVLVIIFDGFYGFCYFLIWRLLELFEFEL